MRDFKRKYSPQRDESDMIPEHLFRWLQEGILITSSAVGIFLFIALVTYHRADSSWSHQVYEITVQNAAGRAGAWLSDFLLYTFGYAAYFFPLIFFQIVLALYRTNHRSFKIEQAHSWTFFLRIIGLILAVISATGLIGLFGHHLPSQLPYESGGILGVVTADWMLHWFNSIGATIILVPIFLISTTFFIGISWVQWIEVLGAFVLDGFSWMRVHLWKTTVVSSGRFQTEWYEWISSFKKRSFERNESIAITQRERIIEPAVTESRPVKPVHVGVSRIEASVLAEKIPRYFKSNIIPKLSLLDSPAPDQKVVINKEMLAERSREVEQKLNDFGVAAEVVAVHPGPVVTRFELALAAGTKVNKITALVKDLARSLSVISVRVVEVIPGKSVVGLELPNSSREKVTLKEVLSSNAYKQSRASLTLALGKDIAGASVIVDLAKMPHLLVAGTTGSGKSVALNTMLLSLLYKSSPEDLRLILIDPKMLELSIYDGIPHLLAPVVTDMKDAASALRWCVVEMERRYRLMATLGVRNIQGYNQKVEEAIRKGAPLLDPFVINEETDLNILKTLPKIVVIADEFADMMVVVGKKVETLIARLAQKARAAGIHLIFATQRPSVDVITGLIKANIPTRIAFQVSSKIDSRTIIDQQGAEQLLGHGDMLYLPPGSGVPVRVHGCFASDEEVHRVIHDLKQRGKPEYLTDILNDEVGVDPTGYTETMLGETDMTDGETDPLYDEAVQFIAKAQRVSVSSIQRRFKIGYNRAARIVEAMEVAGVVSKMEGNAQRDVLVPPPAE